MHKITPIMALTRAISKPVRITHKTLATIDGNPPLNSTSLPNGQRESDAILKQTEPSGMPIIVMHHNIPYIVHKMALTNPPKINQRILPIVFINIYIQVLYMEVELRDQNHFEHYHY